MSFLRRTSLLLFFGILVFGFSQSCSQSNPEPPTAFENPPDWAKEAIWYQIFVERFRNGDSSNDPTVHDIQGAYPGMVPEGWQTTPWTHDWYKDDPYFANLSDIRDFFGNELNYFGQKAQLRRYGGDLQGVLDKMDYLEDLGITAVYFNPLNDAPSLHKYDARNWHHIDRNFGPTPEKDEELIASEDPIDPNTWTWTGADKLFLKVIEEFHKRDIKVIMDFSWNHTGIEFWAWKDVLEKGENSEYADWYWIDEFDDPATEENEFEYTGWAGVRSLPEIKETVRQDHSVSVEVFEGDIYSDEVKQHIFDVTRRWLDPNGDGDPSDGVDGFRLDVAAETPLGFWRQFRKMVRDINPDTYFLGEIWWRQFPDHLLDPEPVVRGDIFDAPMNYRWYRATRHFFNQSPDKIAVSEYVDSLESFKENLRPQSNYAMMNLTASHDVPRFGTSIYNKNKYKYQAKPDDNADYKIDKPDEETYTTMKLILVQQFTYIGAPQIWAGDEMAMWGADDPSTRKPLIWKDYKFEDETTHPNGLSRPTNEVKLNDEWFSLYKQLISIRKEHPVLSTGDFEYLITDDINEILTYSRYNEHSEVIAVFNTGNDEQEIEIPKKFKTEYSNLLNDFQKIETESIISIRLPGRSAAILATN
ncbi:MAG: glycoside hydrolase family 13 protein [Balneolaceae bacterium]|nr:glycoside hydrolase family 13 protein [Balneolaceae bacterium]MBO6546344.1 glycoside hydrolase family 13 protein [Balneolaceae bacterium]MBO6648703.1 glycoside hydrolase family 13 protein [Balneolaceae bacterium]